MHVCMCMCVCSLICNCLTTIGKLLATGWVWVIVGYSLIIMKGTMGKQISKMTLIMVHEMHTTVIVYVYVCVHVCVCVCVCSLVQWLCSQTRVCSAKNDSMLDSTSCCFSCL